MISYPNQSEHDTPIKLCSRCTKYAMISRPHGRGLAAELKIPRLSVGWEGGGYFVNNLVSGLEEGGVSLTGLPFPSRRSGGGGEVIPHGLGSSGLLIML